MKKHDASLENKTDHKTDKERVQQIISGIRHNINRRTTAPPLFQEHTGQDCAPSEQFPKDSFRCSANARNELLPTFRVPNTTETLLSRGPRIVSIMLHTRGAHAELSPAPPQVHTRGTTFSYHHMTTQKARNMPQTYSQTKQHA